MEGAPTRGRGPTRRFASKGPQAAVRTPRNDIGAADMLLLGLLHVRSLQRPQCFAITRNPKQTQDGGITGQHSEMKRSFFAEHRSHTNSGSLKLTRGAAVRETAGPLQPDEKGPGVPAAACSHQLGRMSWAARAVSWRWTQVARAVGPASHPGPGEFSRRRQKGLTARDRQNGTVLTNETEPDRSGGERDPSGNKPPFILRGTAVSRLKPYTLCFSKVGSSEMGFGRARMSVRSISEGLACLRLESTSVGHTADRTAPRSAGLFLLINNIS
ncbi:hypothetical protein SKAU_G00028070 [Synaphobranchus kaupii]|uniref:Uncharacterized protein n=1 Tax=Synaphobranchus kaupii TaxID=118154 RepID=A0A9Q1GEH7_SYNKA|nr:hypothetical protein SKAU_G00028070 [Synaphobranchus kaupii]